MGVCIERELPFIPGLAHKLGHGRAIQIGKRRIETQPIIERPVLDHATAFQKIHQAGVDRFGQF